MNAPTEKELVYDWNAVDGTFDSSTVRRVELDDETLRDGLQSPSFVDPPIEAKIELLHMWGAKRLCIADTVGHATPHGARTLVRTLR